MTVSGIIIRFLIGGGAVVTATLIGRKLGGRVGGIFAAFPVVFASAVISAVLGLPQLQAVERTISISRGALIGMIVNVGCSLAAGTLIIRLGWRRGLFIALGGWLLVAALVFSGGTIWGWF